MIKCPTCGLLVPDSHPFGPVPMHFEAIVQTPVGPGKCWFCTGYHSPNASGKSAASPFWGLARETYRGELRFSTGTSSLPLHDWQWNARPDAPQDWGRTMTPRELAEALGAPGAGRPAVPPAFQKAFDHDLEP